MTATIEIQAAALLLLQKEGYMARFYELMQKTSCTQQEAFALVEAEYFAAFGVNKYANFDSFRRIRRRWRKKRR